MSTLGETLKSPPSSDAQIHVPPSVLPVEPQAENSQPTESAQQQIPVLSTSQRLWNTAYDSLEDDKDTAELVRSYVKTLGKALVAKASKPSAANVSSKLKDPAKRQIHMKRLVEKGQAKISTVSKITKGVGDVAHFILSAKNMIDMAIQNVPQAALPWAGVCVGLQVSIHI